MSQIRVNTIVDANSGNTATINGMTPTAQSLQGFRNRIINGDMRIDQRNNGAAVTVPNDSNFYTVDRWQVVESSSCVLSAQQITDAPAGFQNSLRVTVTTAAGSVGASEVVIVEQRPEGFNVADFGFGTASASTVTLSFWVKSSVTGSFSGSLRNGASNRAYPFSYTISSAGTWEFKTVTIPGDTTGTWVINNGIGMRVAFDIGSGSSRRGTANAWAVANLDGVTGSASIATTLNATFQITGVQLEAGSVATPFERRPYGTELALCQRYYSQLNDLNWVFWAQSNNTYFHSFPLPSPMRASATASVLNAGTPQGGGGTFSVAASASSGRFQVATGSATAQRYGFSGAEISFSAEL